MSSPLACINTNYTLLASSSSTSVKGTASTINTNVKAAIEADATSGKKSYTKTLYTMNLHLHMHLDILKKWKDMSKIYLSHTKIYEYI